MASGVSGSTWNDSEKDEIIRIAESAIETITQLSNVVGRSNPAPVPAVSNSSRSRSENAVDELHRRFPTACSRVSRGSRSIRPAPYPSRRPAGRPRELLTVSKDVIVIEYEHDRVPSKAEKIELEKSKRVISGFEVNREWSAKELERELAALLKGTQMEGFCFEIMKNCSGTLVAPNIPSGRRIDSKLLLKSIAPSGCIYIRLLAELPDESDDMLNYSIFSIPDNQSKTSSVATSMSTAINTTMSSGSSSSTPTCIISPSCGSRSSSTVTWSITTPSFTDLTGTTVDSTDTSSIGSVSTTEGNVNPVNTAAASNIEEHPIQCPFDIDDVISNAKSQNLQDPVELLRFLQERIVKGRQLDMTSCEETCDGETNFITVDRDKVLETTFSELEFVDDYTLTFKVDFMGEESVDHGGPRREWIRLVNREMKAKYFDNGLRQYLSQDYFYVGIMIAVAMLQNGQMPAFMEDHILEEILSTNKTLDPCVSEMKAGLEKLGMLSALQQLPTLIYLLRPGSQLKIAVPRLLQMLKPNFSEEGSNAIRYEKEVYMLFVRYVREVASGRRSCGLRKLELCHILEFVTGASEEPVLGFGMNPSIEFDIPIITRVQDSIRSVQVSSDQGPDLGQESSADSTAQEEPIVHAGFTPTAHTCSNVLSLPRPTHQVHLPPQQKLFDIYDLAFSQPFFGKV